MSRATKVVRIWTIYEFVLDAAIGGITFLKVSCSITDLTFGVLAVVLATLAAIVKREWI